MRKRIGFALLLTFLIGYPFELSAQAIIGEEKKLIQDFQVENPLRPENRVQ